MTVLLSLACAIQGPPAGEIASDDPAADPNAAKWYGDVDAIVLAKCAACHVDGGVAPFALTTYADAAPEALNMAEAVTAGEMPPWLAADGCNEYAHDLSLTPEQIARIVEWAELSAPAGDPADASQVAPPVESLSRVDVTVPMPVAWTPSKQPDDYRCFLIPWTETEATYITGYRVVPATPQVHHVIAYLAEPSQVAEYQALDDAEDGAGWTCFGGPGLGNQQDAAWLGAWAPGATSGDFPGNGGLPIEPGSAIVLQMHYNNDHAAVEPDQSHVEFKLDDAVEGYSFIQPFADPAWLGSDRMRIPAGSAGTAHEFSYRVPYDFQVWTAALHMHTLGVTARLWVEDDAGNETCLLDIPSWDFNWQRTYALAEPLDVENPTFHLRCTWDNPGDEDVAWGEGTGDEMCLATMLWTF
jgi:mono/diheme cytochrome c family protein